MFKMRFQLAARVSVNADWLIIKSSKALYFYTLAMAAVVAMLRTFQFHSFEWQFIFC